MGKKEMKETKEPKEKKKGGKKALLALPIAALLAIVAWMQGCADYVGDALAVFSGGGASGETQNSNDNPDNKTDNPSKEDTDKPSPTPAEDKDDAQGAQENKEIRITVSGKKVSIGKEEIAYTEGNLEELSVNVKTKLTELISDDKKTYLDDQKGDYNVSEAVRKVLSDLGITSIEQNN